MDRQDEPQILQPQPNIPKKTSGSSIQVLLYIAIGILIGVLVAQKAIDFIPSILPTLMAVFIAFFLLIILLIIALPRILNYLVKRYTGKDVDVETAVGDIQTKANHIADTIAAAALTKADPEVQKNIRKDLPDILHYLVFSRLRNTGIRLLMTVFVAIGGLMGTILLYNQNQLLQKQNEKIDNQILLDEASRRSSLNFLMANVLDKIDEELKESERQNIPRHLSPQLIGRISSLSQSFQPYRFIENGEMIEKPLSPERGNLLLALVNSNLDTLTLDTIFQKTIFNYANLRDANLRDADLRGADLSRVNLSDSDLSHANLRDADLSFADLSANFRLADFFDANLSANLNLGDLFGVDLSFADLRDADLRRADLSRADLFDANLRRANLRRADLSRADLRDADLRDADLRDANLRFANLRDADLRGANFREVKSITIKQLKKAWSLYGCENLNAELEGQLKLEKPCLFNEEGCSLLYPTKNRAGGSQR